MADENKKEEIVLISQVDKTTGEVKKVIYPQTAAEAVVVRKKDADLETLLSNMLCSINNLTAKIEELQKAYKIQKITKYGSGSNIIDIIAPENYVLVHANTYVDDYTVEDISRISMQHGKYQIKLSSYISEDSLISLYCVFTKIY